jgi:ParB-like chromosome segregation protein Spo0J
LDVEVPQVELIDVERLQLDGDNPNKMKKGQLKALRDSIVKWGFIVPIITNRDLLVADGEQRITVAKKLGMKQVPVVRLDVEDVDRHLLRQVLNKLKGQHVPELDQEEFIRIIEAGGRGLLQMRGR